MGNIGKKDYAKQKKLRALALIRMFKKRIELGFFDVTLANWWEAGQPDKVILRIDCDVKNFEHLDEIPE